MKLTVCHEVVIDFNAALIDMDSAPSMAAGPKPEGTVCDQRIVPRSHAVELVTPLRPVTFQLFESTLKADQIEPALADSLRTSPEPPPVTRSPAPDSTSPRLPVASFRGLSACFQSKYAARRHSAPPPQTPSKRRQPLLFSPQETAATTQRTGRLDSCVELFISGRQAGRAGSVGATVRDCRKQAGIRHR